jgi:hypothetical protein
MGIVAMVRAAITKGCMKILRGSEAKVESSTVGKCRGRNLVANIIQEVAVVYLGDTRGEIKWLIAEWEEIINKASVEPIDTKDWKILISSPGHTKGQEEKYK